MSNDKQRPATHDTPRPSKTWFIVNISFTIYCILALLYGIFSTPFHNDIYSINDFIYSALISTFFATFLPMLMISAIIRGLGIVIVPVTVLALYINAGSAFYSYFHDQQKTKYAIPNLIFACIPPLFYTAIYILTTLLTQKF